jgi:caffeoyl-CoA O-methyltransferase
MTMLFFYSSYANILLAVLGMALLLPADLMSQGAGKKKDLDDKVRTFLEKRQGTWRDLNIPVSDGKILYDLIIKNNYKKALEIGTSTGYSTIFIAWALSKTGGKVITIEIDKERYRQALTHLKTPMSTIKKALTICLRICRFSIN